MQKMQPVKISAIENSLLLEVGGEEVYSAPVKSSDVSNRPLVSPG